MTKATYRRVYFALQFGNVWKHLQLSHGEVSIGISWGQAKKFGKYPNAAQNIFFIVFGSKMITYECSNTLLESSIQKLDGTQELLLKPCFFFKFFLIL